jgi:adenylate cyclase
MTTILYVDDNAMLQDIFSIFVQRSGFVVKTASCGGECLEILQNAKPDLVLLDIMMYPTDGWETLTSIKSNPDTAEVPVTMLSAKLPVKEEIDRYGGWIEDYLTKPMKFNQISAKLSAILDRRSYMHTAMERMTVLGTDRRMIEEYGSQNRNLFIRKKFSQTCYSDAELFKQDICRIEERIRQLTPRCEV